MIKYFNLKGKRYRARIDQSQVRWVEVWADGDWFRMIPPTFLRRSSDLEPWFIRHVIESNPTREEP